MSTATIGATLAASADPGCKIIIDNLLRHL